MYVCMYTQAPHTHTYIKYMVYMYKGALSYTIVKGCVVADSQG